MNRRAGQHETRLALLGIPVLLAALYPLQARIDAQTQTAQREKEALVLRSGRLLKNLSLGYDSLLANLYWTRTVQYYGRKLHDQNPDFELLQPLLDVTTTLDPQLVVAYRFGTVFLAEPSPIGAGRPDQAVELGRRGIAANPHAWSLWADLGFLYYWHFRDYEKASAAYLEGSKHPQAQPWMKGMAAKIAEEGGSRQTSRFLWTQIYDSATEPQIRENALQHLKGLKAEDDIEQLERLAAEFQRRFGRSPGSFRELISAGMIRGFPVDPEGHPYVLGPGGKVKLDPSSPIRLEILKPFFRREKFS